MADESFDSSMCDENYNPQAALASSKAGTAAKKSSKKTKTIEQTYQKKTRELF